MTAPRIAPLPSTEWSEELARDGLLSANGEPLNIFGTLAHHPNFMKRWMVFANHVMGKSTLPFRDREILILRVGARCRAPYEWNQHAAIARAGGFSDADLSAIASGPDDPHWSPFEATLVRAADELHDDARVSDATWAALGERYDAAQRIDAVAAVGQYHLVSMLLNSCGVQLDDGIADDFAERFPR